MCTLSLYFTVQLAYEWYGQIWQVDFNVVFSYHVPAFSYGEYQSSHELYPQLPLTCWAGLCRRRGWRDPLYETYRSSSGFTCLVLVNGREYQTDLAYESDGLAQENAAMRAFMVCRNFSVNGGMLARNGVVQGLPANESSGRHRRKHHHHHHHHGGRSHSVNLSSSSSTASSE
jgi:hypothetical protein